MTPETLRLAALKAAVLQGCLCEPEVEISEETPGVYRSTIFHDHWCPLLRAVQSGDN